MITFHRRPDGHLQAKYNFTEEQEAETGAALEAARAARARVQSAQAPENPNHQPSPTASDAASTSPKTKT